MCFLQFYLMVDYPNYIESDNPQKTLDVNSTTWFDLTEKKGRGFVLDNVVGIIKGKLNRSAIRADARKRISGKTTNTISQNRTVDKSIFHDIKEAILDDDLDNGAFRAKTRRLVRRQRCLKHSATHGYHFRCTCLRIHLALFKSPLLWHLCALPHNIPHFILLPQIANVIMGTASNQDRHETLLKSRIHARGLRRRA